MSPMVTAGLPLVRSIKAVRLTRAKGSKLHPDPARGDNKKTR